MNDVNLEKTITMTERDRVESVVDQYYFVDFGIVTAVQDGGLKVDVIHAALPSYGGIPGAPTQSTGIEVMWPGGTNFQMKFDILPGDTVLLLGMRNFVQTVVSKAPLVSAIDLHYRQENMKAIPYGLQVAPLAELRASAGGLITIKNNTSGMAAELQKIYTDLINLMLALATFSSGLNPTSLAEQATAFNTAITGTLGPQAVVDKGLVTAIFKDA